MSRFTVITGLALLLAACGGSAASPAASSSQAAASAPAKPAATSSQAAGAPAQTSAPAKPAANASTPPASTAAGTPGKPLSQTKLRFALPINSGLQVLPEVALEAGYFKDEGLDATITSIPTSQIVIAALQKGEIDLANSDSPSVVTAHLSGVDNVILAVPVTKPIFDLMVPASITKPEDLKGKTVAVSRVCDSTCFQISRALTGWGMSPKDVSFLGVTDYTGMFAGLKSGQLSAAALAPPFNFEAKKQGFHSLADLSQLPIEYPTAVVQTVRPFLTAHPDTAVAFLRAYVKAIQRYKSDEAFMVDVYKRFLKSDDTQVIQDTWSYYRNLLHDDPTPTVEGVKFVLDTLAETGTESAKTGNPPDFIAPQYIQQAMSK
ncbi:MAG: ABC transporter substrate-binding protein [Chloroflexota bacterium]